MIIGTLKDTVTTTNVAKFIMSGEAGNMVDFHMTLAQLYSGIYVKFESGFTKVITPVNCKCGIPVDWLDLS